MVNPVGDLLMKGMKDAELPNALLISVFTSRIFQVLPVLFDLFISDLDAEDECTIFMLMILNF